jgi:hypothetical protein
LEDFLTEVLAEWLRLVTAEGVLAQALDGLFQMPWATQVPERTLTNVTWTTQHTIAPGHPGVGKRPDLVGRGHDFFLIIENKIGAGLSWYESDDGSSHQLDVYRSYLESRSESYRGIVMLTHHTAPPSDWRDPVVRWRQVYRWLGHHQMPESSPLGYLSTRFSSFLEELGMANTRISLTAIAALGAFNELQAGCVTLGKVATQEMQSTTLPTCLGRPWGGSGGQFVWPNFFGEVRSRSGGKVDDSDLILWCGVLAGQVYEIAPTVAGVPEISVGIACWTSQSSMAPGARDELIQAADAMNGKAPGMSWRSGVAPCNGPDSHCVFMRADRSFMDLYRDANGGDWDEPVQDFVRSALDELTSNTTLTQRFENLFA